MGKGRKTEQTSVQLNTADLELMRELVKQGDQTTLAGIVREAVRCWLNQHYRVTVTEEE